MSEKKERPKPWVDFKKGTNRFTRPLWAMEWCWEWVSYGLSRWAFLEVLEYAGKLTIVVALVTYILGADERKRNAENQRQAAEDQRKAKHFQAWQVINSAEGKGGDGGRSLAIQELARNRVSLARLNLEDARLYNFAVSNASFVDALVSNATLMGVTIDASFLRDVDFSASTFADCSFKQNDYGRAVFTGSFVSECDFSGSNFEKADFGNSQWVNSNLTNAKLRDVNVAGAAFLEVNFANADFKGVHEWKSIVTFTRSNIYGLTNAPDGFVEWAIGKGAVVTNITDHQLWSDFVSKSR